MPQRVNTSDESNNIGRKFSRTEMGDPSGRMPAGSLRILCAGFMAVALLLGCDGSKKINGVVPDLPGPDTVKHDKSAGTLPADDPEPVATSKPATSGHPEWISAADLSEEWSVIVIHHSGSDVGSLEQIDKQHRESGRRDGGGYHFVIGNGSGSGDGEVEMAPQWRHQVAGVSWPCTPESEDTVQQIDTRSAISVVVVGDLNAHGLGLDQTDSLVELIAFLMDQCHIPADRVVTHRGWARRPAASDCPGRYFSLWDIKRRLAERQSKPRPTSRPCD